MHAWCMWQCFQLKLKLPSTNSYLYIQELLYDVHYWIGQYSTADEYGTAAYKTVELDTLVSFSAALYIHHALTSSVLFFSL